MIRRPPRSTLFPLHDALPISYAGRSWLLRMLNDTMVGKTVASAFVTAYSDPSLPGFGHYKYDHEGDRKSTRLNSSHSQISYAVFCLKKKKQKSMNMNYSVDIC